MLVLTLKPGQTVQIGEGPDAIKILSPDANKRRMQIGIDAPKDKKIFRIKPETVSS